MSIWAKAWHRWKIIGGVVGNYQARSVATIFFYTIMVPFGLGVRIFSDPLRVKEPATNASWVPRQDVDTRLNQARRQF